MQTKKQSIIEVVTNTGIGFVISLIATFVVFPLLDIDSSIPKNVIITICFTVISIIRSYLVRRWFNTNKTEPIEQLVLEARLRIANNKIKLLENKRYAMPIVSSQKLQCFNCEIEMPTKIIEGHLCCSNCGMMH